MMPKYKRYRYDPNIAVPERTARRQPASFDQLSRASSEEKVEDEEDVIEDVVPVHCEQTIINECANDDSFSSESVSGAEDTEDISMESLQTPDSNVGPDENEETNSCENFVPDADPVFPPNDISDEVNAPGELSSFLCQCSQATEGEALLMVLALSIRHNLSYEAMTDIMNMLKILFRGADLKSSKYYFLKHFEPDKSEHKFHFYCPECSRYLGALETIEKDSAFQCICGNSLNNLRLSKSFFMTLGLRQQLQQLFKVPEVAANIDYRFTRTKDSPEAIEDLYDGEVYRRLSEPGEPLSDPNNISFSFCTDGYPIGRSSVQQGWPVYLSINELPPKLRKKHMILAGMWVGSAPDMQMYLQPLVNDINDLHLNGFKCIQNDVEIIRFLVPLACCVDSQARWKVLNMKNFAGYYGCTFCEHPGDPSPKGVRYKIHADPPPERTDASIKEQMVLTQDRIHLPYKDRPVKGVRRPSALMNMLKMDLRDCMSCDSMHVLKGIGEKHLCLLLRKHLNDDDLLTVNRRLADIRPPSVITRTPRPVKHYEKYKASEWRSFIVFYGVVVLEGLVSRKYLAHFGLLSCAIFTLLQKSVTIEQVSHAHNLLVAYVALFQEYYGTGQMCYNVHLLLHLAKGVKDLGPLWTHSCYPFEDKNRSLMQMQKSAAHVAKEVSRKFSTASNLPTMCDKFEASDEVLDFCGELFNGPFKYIVRGDQWSLLGKSDPYCLIEEEKACMILAGMEMEHVSHVTKFSRMLCNGMRLTTFAYCAGSKRDNSVVYLKDRVKVRIVNIVRMRYQEVPNVKMFAEVVHESDEPVLSHGQLSVTHVKKVIAINKLLILNPNDIKGQCIIMDSDVGTYVSCVPYGCVAD